MKIRLGSSLPLYSTLKLKMILERPLTLWNNPSCLLFQSIGVVTLIIIQGYNIHEFDPVGPEEVDRVLDAISHLPIRSLTLLVGESLQDGDCQVNSGSDKFFTEGGDVPKAF